MGISDTTQARIASVLVMLVGFCLLISPLAVDIHGGALTSVRGTGVVLMLSGLVQVFWISYASSWVNALAAIWLFISAFAFPLRKLTVLVVAIAALITLALSSWDSLEIEAVKRPRHHI